ncbi:MAG: NAD(P)-dependent glycerol-3-phosphate dehydrogenase [Vicinamibacteria bacterium]|nr:NAD(P)-dependent glycerol-3-phosphate dehydrogenase [Vicinamibacteria bacterium]
MKVAVLGGGAFGTALAVHLKRLAREASIWTRSEKKAAEIPLGSNHGVLPGVDFEPGLLASTDIDSCLEGAEFAVLATPSMAIQETLLMVATKRPGLPLVCGAKGIDPRTLRLHSQIAAAAAPSSPYCALTGPSFARELIAAQPTALVAASVDAAFAQAVQSAFSGPRLRVYETDDVPGAEMAGSLKNVIAIAAGMVAGLKCGENTRAALITRGLAEISRLVVASGGRAETVAGLAGLGDLVLTCSSNQSRNFQFGRLVAEGNDPALVLQSLGTVEGFRTSSAACLLGERLQVETPIAREVRGVLVQGVAARDAVEALMLRRLKREVH